MILIRKRQVGLHEFTAPVAELREYQRHENHPSHYWDDEHHQHQIFNCKRCKNNQESSEACHPPTKGSPLDGGLPIHMKNVDV
jgi:hypothetical protein